MRSVLSDEKKLSIAALSQTLPERLEARAYVAQRKRIEQEMLAREAAQRTAPPEPEPAPVKIMRVRAPARHVGPRVRGM